MTRTLKTDIVRENLEQGIHYLERMLPKIKNKEIPFSQACEIVDYMDDLYTACIGRKFPGLQNEINEIYGRTR